MDNLKKMEPQKLAIVTAGIVVVLGLIGVITGSKALGIVALLLQAGVVFYIIASGSEQAQERTQSDKYRKLFKNLPIGFAQAKIIMDPSGTVTGYQVEDANNTFGSYFNLDRDEFVGRKQRQNCHELSKMQMQHTRHRLSSLQI